MKAIFDPQECQLATSKTGAAIGEYSSPPPIYSVAFATNWWPHTRGKDKLVWKSGTSIKCRSWCNGEKVRCRKGDSPWLHACYVLTPCVLRRASSCSSHDLTQEPGPQTLTPPINQNVSPQTPTEHFKSSRPTSWCFETQIECPTIFL